MMKVDFFEEEEEEKWTYLKEKKPLILNTNFRGEKKAICFKKFELQSKRRFFNKKDEKICSLQ